ncbi:MAG: hypothetical protein QY326_04500 [Bdellovibrionota bacterium]|nr:MAG: hypothetical protein QY326_04500 [Bdellovibrionota bacterium]
MQSPETEYTEILASDPGDEVFVDYGDYLRRTGRLNDALLITLRGLSHTPDNSRGRLLLARLYFELGFTPFAVREIRELQAEYPQRKFLRQLLLKLAPDEKLKEVSDSPVQPEPASKSSSETFAEGEFDFEALEDLEHKEQKP